jgi:hypothetical protein
MRRSVLLRGFTLALAYAHAFPASNHLVAFVREPSISEAWKGFGALVAIGLYLLPPRTQVRLLRSLWRRRRLLGAVTWVLAAVHAVPLVEHLPRFLASGAWGDGWRGIGASIAVAWFLSPVPQQAALLAAAARLTRLPLRARFSRA